MRPDDLLERATLPVPTPAAASNAAPRGLHAGGAACGGLRSARCSRASRLRRSRAASRLRSARSSCSGLQRDGPLAAAGEGGLGRGGVARAAGEPFAAGATNDAAAQQHASPHRWHVRGPSCWDDAGRIVCFRQIRELAGDGGASVYVAAPAGSPGCLPACLPPGALRPPNQVGTRWPPRLPRQDDPRVDVERSHSEPTHGRCVDGFRPVRRF